ncbi:MAG: 6-carboxytetrahydropterin synthase [Aquabacterium sp.]|nr:6-carboxytetrahydropterin synthase [Aquabacterium sp.]
MFELSQTFSFDAAHTLKRKVSPEEAAGSRRIHGHTYTAEIFVRGERQPDSGMVVDLAVLREVTRGNASWMRCPHGGSTCLATTSAPSARRSRTSWASWTTSCWPG